MPANEPYLYPTSTAARAGNAALLIAGMIILFSVTSAVLITGATVLRYQTPSQVETYIAGNLVFFGLGGMLLYFWWKTRPVGD